MLIWLSSYLNLPWRKGSWDNLDGEKLAKNAI